MAAYRDFFDLATAKLRLFQTAHKSAHSPMKFHATKNHASPKTCVVSSFNLVALE